MPVLAVMFQAACSGVFALNGDIPVYGLVQPLFSFHLQPAKNIITLRIFS
jgi:hypothetical protein